MTKTFTNEEFLQKLKDKNIKHIPLDKYINMNTPIRFQCGDNPSHIWAAKPANVLLNGTGCPYCSGRLVTVGVNDIWTTNPELASLLTNPDDGFKYSQSSSKKASFTCPDCGYQSTHIINNVKKRGLSCPVCSDGISIPNRFMAQLLSDADIKYIHEYIISGASFRYDFYIPEMNMIIEMHGRQHYEETNWGIKSLNDEKRNDEEKMSYAINNGVKKYIVIDCKETEIDYIYNNIKNSSIYYLFKNLDIREVFKKSMRSKLIEACRLYNNGLNATQISKELCVTRGTARSWIKTATKLGFCDYVPAKGNMYDKKNILLLNTKEVFESISEASKKYNICTANISAVCYHKRNYAGVLNGYGMVWRFLDDYDESVDYELKAV